MAVPTSAVSHTAIVIGPDLSPLEGARIDVAIDDLLAEFTLTQQFRNTTPRDIEAVFSNWPSAPRCRARQCCPHGWDTSRRAAVQQAPIQSLIFVSKRKRGDQHRYRLVASQHKSQGVRHFHVVIGSDRLVAASGPADACTS